ncbi:NUDIX domain-containing protein [Profundibacter sp.]
MNIWRPRQTIRVIAIGLNWRDGKLLATETMDNSGNIKGVRPLSGGVEFGETWQEALVREFQEELHIEITIISKPWVMENIYTHEGETGHEIVFCS